MKQTLETLGLESLEGISLARLSRSIRENLPADVDKGQVLDIYIMWLYPRLMALDLSAKAYLGLEVFNMYMFLKALPDDDGQLAEAFNDWQRGQAVENSASSRKLSIAAAEFHRLVPASQESSERRMDSSNSEDRFGQMHPDRAKLSQGAPIVVELDDGDDDEVVIISSNFVREGRSSARDHDRIAQPGLSFLTGPNKLPMNGRSMATHNIDSEDSGVLKFQREPVSEPKYELVSKSATSASPLGRKLADAPQRPHEDYVCARCMMKGDHCFRDCPVLDPAFDTKPPESYICRLCKRRGEHHVSVCPRNKNPRSMTQRRLEFANQNGHPGVDHRGRPIEDRRTGARGPSSSPRRTLKKHTGTDTPDCPKEIYSSRSPTLAQVWLGKRKTSSSPPASHKRGAPASEIRGSPTLPSTLKAKRPSKKARLSHGDEVHERDDGNSYVGDHQLFELAVLDLIKAESIKTDLLQPDFFSGPSLRKPPTDQENVSQANQTTDTPRMSVADLYDLRDDGEQPVETVGTEMVASTEAVMCNERVPVSTQEVAELAMALAGLENSTAVGEEDAATGNAEPETDVVVSTDAARPAMLTTGSFQWERSSIEPMVEDAEVGIMAGPPSDRVYPVKGLEREAVSTMETEEPDQVVDTGLLPDQSAANEAIDTNEAKSQSPHSANKSVMEVEETVTADEKSPATSDEPLKLVAEPEVDAEMAERQVSPVTEVPAVAGEHDMWTAFFLGFLQATTSST
ncbi:uncharacterized protein B0H64DRAFT_433784 [Chaetomium fimeti]|uniref:Zinc knuckle CX2CX3GHX4C domain-containing protein n=1 Tax=Chaetomium fimeti TaxID=1854472 RepID=A0AAE0LR07_9PEZI|nr:hypothetical protein B0H64DRAFT_433784 [Chaetomium fimeti]